MKKLMIVFVFSFIFSINSFAEEKYLLLFDWDDTLFPASFLKEKYNGSLTDVIDADDSSKLQTLEKAVKDLLEAALKVGSVSIVTNGKGRWVELSARKYLPSIITVFDRIHIVSAKSIYEKKYPSRLEWKYYAFQKEISEFHGNIPEDVSENFQVISMGDSLIERAAIQAVTKGVDQISATKSIKLAKNPSIEKIIKQLELLTKKS